MDFDLSKPQKLLQQSARELLSRECKPDRVRAAMATDTANDCALWTAAADQGWMGLIVPERFGGLGLGVVELAAVMEEMGRACMPGPLFSTIFAGAVMARLRDEELQKQWLEPLAAGELKATVANVGQALSLSGSPSGNEGQAESLSYVPFVMDAAVADVILVIDGDGVIPIERGAADVTITRTPSMDETRKLYTLSFPSGKAAAGATGLQSAIDTATVALCAEMVGGMQWILETTVAYAKTRQQFGRVIGSFQAVQHHCADMLLLTESARSATYYAAWTLTHDPAAAPIATSMAKAYCSDAYREVGNKGIQVHGGIGFTWEHDLQLYYKRAKASETMFGDATFHRERIAKGIVDR
jgi:alkylation response protein AidB-like acyl-CoA dehydrogenase